MSMVNPEAPLLTDEVIGEFKSRPDLLTQVRFAIDEMVGFFGPEDWLTRNNHNFLRITRILNFLKAIEFNYELNLFYKVILVLTENHKDVVGERTFLFWKNAFEGKVNE
jgi:hypothetical protein